MLSKNYLLDDMLDYMKENNMTAAECYDLKLHQFMITLVKHRISTSFLNGMDLISLEYNLMGHCPFFVDRDMLINARVSMIAKF